MLVSRKAVGAIPALAQTMSSRPNRATPSSTAARTAWKSRTSATVPSIVAPAASTSAIVSFSSSRLAIGYPLAGMSAQMSIPMMSAPSPASRSAWLRPWPRATPVMKATLPSNEPMNPRFTA